MAASLQDWFTNILGVQSVAEFGAQQPQYQHDPAVLAEVDCSSYLLSNPEGFERTSLAFFKDNLAVVPEWGGGSIKSSWLNVESADAGLVGCMQKTKTASFIAFDEAFLELIGTEAKLQTIQSFEGEDANHVHEAPVYLSQTGELVFADTSVIGWLWALDVETHETRKIRTSPPLHNVNGATHYDSRLYLTTNGSPTPAVWNCSLPTKPGQTSATDETITCSMVVNNYRLAHLNSPNDLIFTSQGNIFFTDPAYGWAQSWPGVGPPELPTAIYFFHTGSKKLLVLSNNEVLHPNGLALSADEKTLYIAESNSTSGQPIGVWDDSVRNVYAFDFDEDTRRLGNKRLVHVVERGWPDGLRLSNLRNGRELLLVAGMGGVDVVDTTDGGAGVLLGKFNVGDDIVFNLEPVGKTGVWLLTGKKGVYKVTIAE
ncbi:hypothetical protein OHC33_010012 [Knufia fluminis]|uniref:SMP-30/Gluconolactonase/LRE-like region domain-containing protein n=1 Tax=Knufia fluminis TaxID=191047 RepID=A0AAN8EZA1_9EURO|nr:hypothetical protein OHC33_010012 [Knufia fluminis]